MRMGLGKNKKEKFLSYLLNVGPGGQGKKTGSRRTRNSAQTEKVPWISGGTGVENEATDQASHWVRTF